MSTPEHTHNNCDKETYKISDFSSLKILTEDNERAQDGGVRKLPPEDLAFLHPLYCVDSVVKSRLSRISRTVYMCDILPNGVCTGLNTCDVNC